MSSVHLLSAVLFLENLAVVHPEGLITLVPSLFRMGYELVIKRSAGFFTHNLVFGLAKGRGGELDKHAVEKTSELWERGAAEGSRGHWFNHWAGDLLYNVVRDSSFCTRSSLFQLTLFLWKTPEAIRKHQRKFDRCHARILDAVAFIQFNLDHELRMVQLVVRHRRVVQLAEDVQHLPCLAWGRFLLEEGEEKIDTKEGQRLRSK